MLGDTIAIYGGKTRRKCVIKECMRHFWQASHIILPNLIGSWFTVCQTVSKPKWVLERTMQVLDLSPMKESLSTFVKVLIRKGMWSLFFPSERMHSWRTRNELPFKLGAYIFNSRTAALIWWARASMLVIVLPWEPAGCGWFLPSQPKWCGHCCWRPCRARCQPDRPMKIYRGAWWRGRCAAAQSGGPHESETSWRWPRSGLMFWRGGRTEGNSTFYCSLGLLCRFEEEYPMRSSDNMFLYKYLHALPVCIILMTSSAVVT